MTRQGIILSYPVSSVTSRGSITLQLLGGLIQRLILLLPLGALQ